MAGPSSAGDFIVGFVVGCAAMVVLLALAVMSLARSGDIYGLGHWKLNLKTPLPSMWMNLGTRDDGSPVDHFDEAARNMLQRILDAAGLLAAALSARDSVAVLDVGFGCGDQTVALAELIRAPSRQQFRYVGLTLNAVQLQAARGRLAGALAPERGGGETALGLSPDSFRLFQADAARPEHWGEAVCTAVDGLADESFSERWLMGLDCLYHFSPSRKPIFKRAAQTLGANVMAFDLILSDEASVWGTLAVRLLGFVLLCPWRAFLTEEQYRGQLVECGYDGARVEIRDVSDHVFAGLSGYLRRQDAALGRYGISLTGYTLVGRVYEWLDRTRVLKAAIVVGRRKGKSQ
ncbi:hypothetical protein Trco_001689 [Trichoderma cornu-damae]|uniref:S-adenosyl-L-methionine-dependent methyltransferase n=1 Tax=Trichoderma cornu-damae TaxID=654480 RepID=A0A9P8QSC4_9HYPO|nr:hypothetical protein Trco_001689 [Trichoderma cornu-damae]